MWANYTGGSVNNPVINIGEFNLLYEIDLDFLQCTAQYTKSSLKNKYDQQHNNGDIDKPFGSHLIPFIISVALSRYWPLIPGGRSSTKRSFR